MKPAITVLALLFTTGPASAALVERLGGLAYYDDDLNITWLADANFAKTSGFDSDGAMNWTTATAWAGSLNVGGVTGWRLPTVHPVNGAFFNFTFTTDGSSDEGSNTTAINTTASELPHLFYQELGNTSDLIRVGGGSWASSGGSLKNTGPFKNVEEGKYWTNRPHPFVQDSVFYFYLPSGVQTLQGSLAEGYAWPVRYGDVGPNPIPLPAASYLFASAIAGLGILRRRPAQRL